MRNKHEIFTECFVFFRFEKPVLFPLEKGQDAMYRSLCFVARNEILWRNESFQFSLFFRVDGLQILLSTYELSCLEPFAVHQNFSRGNCLLHAIELFTFGLDL